MCNLYDLGRGRHKSNDEWEEAVAQVIRESEKPPIPGSPPDPIETPKLFGIRKTDPGLVLTLNSDHPVPEVMRWGFYRSYNPAVNNARSEKLSSTWALPWRERQRCLIPLSSFYEWQGSTGAKQTFAFCPRDPDEIFWAAGIWEKTPDGLSNLSKSFSMLTREASGQITEIHHRMPVILTADQRMEYLEANDPENLISSSRIDLQYYRCENPLKNPQNHEGPIRQNFLPGFDL